MNHNVIGEIVANDLCIGCGICVGMCPQGILKIQDNKYGEYIPTETKKCNSNCGLCLDVCPFSSNENETQIGEEIYGSFGELKYLFETGYYLDSFVGYSSDFRQSSASGGMATWLLTEMLREHIIDYVICPINQKNSKELFSFQILNYEDSVRSASGSVYYPVEMSEVIKRILETSGRYAVTGLPCFIKALRLAAKKNRKLKERIIFTIGLVCGQMKSKHFTEYIAALASNGMSRELQRVYYRGKSSDRPASNFYYLLIDEQGSKYKIFWNEGISEAWVNRWFTPNVCNYCDDVFAELADVTFMDAWLPEFSEDSRGTNLMLVRNPEILDCIYKGIERKEIIADKIPIEKLIESQAEVLDLKRDQLSYRLHIALQNGQYVPKKRVLRRSKVGAIKERKIKLKLKMQKDSKELFLECCKIGILDIKTFKSGMKPHIIQKRLLRLAGLIELPFQVIKRIK